MKFSILRHVTVGRTLQLAVGTFVIVYLMLPIVRGEDKVADAPDQLDSETDLSEDYTTDGYDEYRDELSREEYDEYRDEYDAYVDEYREEYWLNLLRSCDQLQDPDRGACFALSILALEASMKELRGQVQDLQQELDDERRRQDFDPRDFLE